MPDLSPQAQAVVDAAVGYPAFATKKRIAAAFRALAHHEGENVFTYDDGKFAVVREGRILSLAAELDAAT
jgi:hypothetical protein